MSPIKVLYIAPSSGIGGVETFLIHLAKHHNPSTVKPVFLLFNNGPLANELRTLQAHHIVLPTPPRLSRPWTWLVYAKMLKKIIHEEKIQIVHSSMAYAALFSAFPSSRKAIHVWFQHGPVSGWMDTLAELLPYKLIFYNSQFTLKTQLKRNFFRKKIDAVDLVIDLGCEPYDQVLKVTDRKNMLAELNLNANVELITMACRMQPWKGIHIAIAALQLLLKKMPSRSIRLLIFGDNQWDPAYTEALRRQSQNLPVLFLEARPSITHEIAASDVVINASTTPEPFGMTLIEALACGTIAIGPHHGGPVEILAPSLKECLFEPNNPQSLALTIEHCLDIKNKERLQMLSQKLFSSRFHIKNMIKKMEDAYKTLL